MFAPNNSRLTLNDIFGSQGDMLHTSATIIVNILLNLTFTLPDGRFVDGHLDRLLVVGHHDRTQRRVLRVHLLVVHRPESMELQHMLIPLGHLFHLQVGLVAHAVIDEAQVHLRQSVQEVINLRRRT